MLPFRVMYVNSCSTTFNVETLLFISVGLCAMNFMCFILSRTGTRAHRNGVFRFS